MCVCVCACVCVCLLCVYLEVCARVGVSEPIFIRESSTVVHKQIHNEVLLQTNLQPVCCCCCCCCVCLQDSTWGRPPPGRQTYFLPPSVTEPLNHSESSTHTVPLHCTVQACTQTIHNTPTIGTYIPILVKFLILVNVRAHVYTNLCTQTNTAKYLN